MSTSWPGEGGGGPDVSWTEDGVLETSWPGLIWSWDPLLEVSWSGEPLLGKISRGGRGGVGWLQAGHTGPLIPLGINLVQPS